MKIARARRHLAFAFFSSLSLLFGLTFRATAARTVSRLSQSGNEAPSAQIETFTGAIRKNGTQFVLRETGSQKWYQLDDQETAAKFEEKAVKVTGILDPVRNIIRVRSIEEAGP